MQSCFNRTKGDLAEHSEKMFQTVKTHTKVSKVCLNLSSSYIKETLLYFCDVFNFKQIIPDCKHFAHHCCFTIFNGSPSLFSALILLNKRYISLTAFVKGFYNFLNLKYSISLRKPIDAWHTSSEQNDDKRMF